MRPPSLALPLLLLVAARGSSASLAGTGISRDSSGLDGLGSSSKGSASEGAIGQPHASSSSFFSSPPGLAPIDGGDGFVPPSSLGSRPGSKRAKNVLTSRQGGKVGSSSDDGSAGGGEAQDESAKGYCSPSGPIEHTLCSYEHLEQANAQGGLYEALHRLVDFPFFRLYKVDLFKECPFWYENTFCMNRDCSVVDADESEVPEKWRMANLGEVGYSSEQAAESGGEPAPSCNYLEADFCLPSDEATDEGSYVDLALNPERFTGYAGESASRVWGAIYRENCFGLGEMPPPAAAGGGGGPGGFGASGLSSAAAGNVLGGAAPPSPAFGAGLIASMGGGGGGGGGLLVAEGRKGEMDEEECLEKRVYYRVISGLHASISTHICQDYLDTTTGLWAPNLDCFINRIAAHPDRLQNMYFNLAVLLRAVDRAGPYLAAYDVCTGGDGELDRKAEEEVRTVVEAVKKAAGDEVDGRVFDERELFRGEDAAVLKEEFKDRFRNVSRIMDCVGCDKCRLWGKVQVQGIGTALKILFELDEAALDPTVNPTLLSRQEIVALFNTLHRFSESLHAVEQFRQIYAERQAAEGVSDQTTPRVRNPSRSASPSRRRGSTAQPYTSTTKRFWLALRQSASARWRTLKARCSSGFVACLQAWLGREWAARIATLTGGDATAVVGAAGARGDSPPSAPSIVPKPQAFGLKAEL